MATVRDFTADSIPLPAWTKLPLHEKHHNELIVEAYVSTWYEALDTVVNYLKTASGRPQFTVPMDEKKQLAMWENPQTRAGLLVSVFKAKGPKAVTEMVEDMNEKIKARDKRIEQFLGFGGGGGVGGE